MKRLKIICTILLSISIIAVPFLGHDNYVWLFLALKDLRQFNGNVPPNYTNYLLETTFLCFCFLVIFATLILLLIVLWKSDLAILTESISEKGKAKRKAAKQAKLQREIAEKTAQLEELNNQPSGEENGE